MKAHIDFETYSEAGYSKGVQGWTGLPSGHKGIEAVGAAKYAEHESTRVLCLAYQLPGGPIQVWTPNDEPPYDLCAWVAELKGVEAFNAVFEYYIWNYCLFSRDRERWPVLNLFQLSCAAAKARAWGLPGSLAGASRAVGTKQKLANGKQLINTFCVPTGSAANGGLFGLEQTDQQLIDYCIQDVASEVSVSEALPDIHPIEQEVWNLTEKANVRGFYVDTQLARRLADFARNTRMAWNKQAAELMPGLLSLDATAYITMQAAANGYNMVSCDEAAVNKAIADLPDCDFSRLLKLRQAYAAPGADKPQRLLEMTSEDGRLRGAFIYHGAFTGRWTSGGVQLHNLTSDGPDIDGKGWRAEAMAEAIKILAECEDRDAALEAFGYDLLKVIAACVRGLLIATPGCRLMVADYSAIEAVVLAELAGEAWRQDLFRTHGKIYEKSGSLITGIPFEQIDSKHPARRTGKVAELASGYGGGVGAWKAFGAGSFMADDEIKAAVAKWRAESPAIVSYWKELEKAAKYALAQPGPPYTWISCRGVGFARDANSTLYCKLPSGRFLTYRRAAVVDDGIEYDFKSGRTRTWGGKLTENVVQAVARDLLAHGMLKLDKAGYNIIGHVHDEVIIDQRVGDGTLVEVLSVMTDLPAWAQGWPVSADGWEGQRYRK